LPTVQVFSESTMVFARRFQLNLLYLSGGVHPSRCDGRESHEAMRSQRSQNGTNWSRTRGSLWMDVWKIIEVSHPRKGSTQLWLLPQWYTAVTRRGVPVVCQITKAPLCLRIEVRDSKMEFAAVPPDAYTKPILPLHACSVPSQYSGAELDHFVMSVHCTERQSVLGYLGGSACNAKLVCQTHHRSRCGQCGSVYDVLEAEVTHADHKLYLILAEKQGFWPTRKYDTAVRARSKPRLTEIQRSVEDR
jgi:hypothetical protein